MIMNENFAYWFRVVVKWITPVSFFIIASWPGSYWLAGVMLIVTLFYYTLQWKNIGDKPNQSNTFKSL
jgi:hypothetical protein